MYTVHVYVYMRPILGNQYTYSGVETASHIGHCMINLVNV